MPHEGHVASSNLDIASMDYLSETMSDWRSSKAGALASVYMQLQRSYRSALLISPPNFMVSPRAGAQALSVRKKS